MHTLSNTKSNGRRAALIAITDAMSVADLRHAATTLVLKSSRRHFAAGFAEIIDRRTCWDWSCNNMRHEGDSHSDGHGNTWVQARGTKYCPVCGEYTTCHANKPHATEYPYVNANGETVWGCCESTIGPACGHIAS